MVKVSKKVIWLISSISSVVVAATTTLCGLSLNSNSNLLPNNSTNNYRYYSLSTKIGNNEKINTLIDYLKDERNVVYFINEKKFLDNFKSIVQDSLRTISTFSSNYLNYIIDCHYKINDSTSILIKIEWYLPNSNIKYYDQFKIYLDT